MGAQSKAYRRCARPAAAAAFDPLPNHSALHSPKSRVCSRGAKCPGGEQLSFLSPHFSRGAAPWQWDGAARKLCYWLEGINPVHGMLRMGFSLHALHSSRSTVNLSFQRVYFYVCYYLLEGFAARCLPGTETQWGWAAVTEVGDGGTGGWQCGLH